MIRNQRSSITVAIIKFTLSPKYSHYMHVEVVCYFQVALN